MDNRLRSRIAAFVIVVQAILFLGHWFIYETWRHFAPPRAAGVTLALRFPLALLSVSFVAASLLSFLYYNFFVRIFYTLAAVWTGFLNFLFFAACACWIAYLVVKVSGLPIGRSGDRGRAVRTRCLDKPLGGDQRLLDARDANPRCAAKPAGCVAGPRRRARHGHAPGPRAWPPLHEPHCDDAPADPTGYYFHRRRSVRRDEGRSRSPGRAVERNLASLRRLLRHRKPRGVWRSDKVLRRRCAAPVFAS